MSSFENAKVTKAVNIYLVVILILFLFQPVIRGIWNFLSNFLHLLIKIFQIYLMNLYH